MPTGRSHALLRKGSEPSVLVASDAQAEGMNASHFGQASGYSWQQARGAVLEPLLQRGKFVLYNIGALDWTRAAGAKRMHADR